MTVHPTLPTPGTCAAPQGALAMAHDAAAIARHAAAIASLPKAPLPMARTARALNTRVSGVYDYCETVITDDNSTVYDLWIGGRTPLNGGGANGVPRGRWSGRIWHRHDGTWYATPEGCNWVDLTWYGPFKSRRDAALFLAGMAAPRPEVAA